MEHGLEQWMRDQNIAIKIDWLRACLTWIQQEEVSHFYIHNNIIILSLGKYVWRGKYSELSFSAMVAC